MKRFRNGCLTRDTLCLAETITDTFGTSTQVLTDFIVVENCFGASVDENEKYDLDIYPTIITSNSIIKLHNPLNQKVIYKLYSAKGRMIDYQTISNNQIKIGDLSSAIICKKTNHFSVNHGTP